MSEKTYLLILKTGIYASLFTVFFVFKDLLFPFISSKQISFNIMIEILMVFWLAFIIKFPDYRPKWSYISFGLIAFFFALVISSIFGVDFELSFWGDVERMLGVFHLLHFLFFYLIAITVMRSWLDWKIFFIISTALALIVSFIGLGQDEEAYATIGNTAYVSGYLIFNMFFCLILFAREKAEGLRWLYLLPLPIYFFQFNKADTTGAYVGLGIGLMALFFLYGILVKNKRIKLATLGIFLFLAVSAGLLLANKDSDFVRNNSLLAPIAGIDLQKNTFQTRLISWKAAFKDFKTHPILGTGHGNYAIIFDKYFDPVFLNYTSSETYFDRAHNNVIDIASTAGIIGLITYLSIFGAVGYYLVMGYRKGYFGIHEFVIVSSLLIAYFVQNLAVFDSLVTYVGLMITLAFIYWLYEQGEKSALAGVKDKVREAGRQLLGREELQNRETYALLGFGLFIFIIMWQYNIKPYNMLVQTIAGQKAWAAGNPVETIEVYKKALSQDTILDRDSRTSLIRLFASGPEAFSAFPEAERLSVADYLIELAERNVAYNKEDSLNQLTLAQMLDTASKLAMNDPSRFVFYNDRALEAVNAAIAASPGRPPVYYQKAQILLTRGDKEQALETIRQAYALNEIYQDSACHLGKTLLFMEKEEEGLGYIDKCIDLGGARLLGSTAQMKSYIPRYQKNGQSDRIIKIYETVVNLDPSDTKAMIELAKLYAKAGQTDKAINMAAKISEKDPSVRSYVDDFIKSLD